MKITIKNERNHKQVLDVRNVINGFIIRFNRRWRRRGMKEVHRTRWSK